MNSECGREKVCLVGNPWNIQSDHTKNQSNPSKRMPKRSLWRYLILLQFNKNLWVLYANIYVTNENVLKHVASFWTPITRIYIYKAFGRFYAIGALRCAQPWPLHAKPGAAPPPPSTASLLPSCANAPFLLIYYHSLMRKSLYKITIFWKYDQSRLFKE
jgi:hypothetical protein